MSTKVEAVLTELQEKFCHAFIETGGSRTQSAQIAGYSENNAKVIGSQLLTKPHVQRRIAELQRAQIGGDLASRALNVLDELLTNPKTPPAVRLGAARTAMQAAGIDSPKNSQNPLENKDLSEMDLSELSAFIKAGAARIQNMRNPIDGDAIEAEILSE